MQIESSKLKSVRGMVIGIGRVKIPKMSDFNYEIPLLPFVVIEKENGGYVSSCIHLQIDGYGKTVEEAQSDMLDNILYYLDVNFHNERGKDSCWANILDLFEANESSSALWDKYHAYHACRKRTCGRPMETDGKNWRAGKKGQRVRGTDSEHRRPEK